MSSPSERRPGVWATRLTGLGALAAAVLMLGLPPAVEPARAGVATEDARSAFDAAAAPGAASAPSPSPLRYQLRCWQWGLLVIEETGLELPPAGPAATSAQSTTGSVRLRATDARQQPLYLTETRNATCLVRPVPTPQPAGK